MKKQKFRAVWQTCEKLIAYCSLVVVVVLECLDKFVPSLDVGQTDFSLMLIASSLLVIFSHIEDIKKECTQSTNTHASTRFNDGLLEVFSKNKRLKSLDIMAHTTKTYIHSIADNDVTIDNVRILVCKPKDSASRHYPDAHCVQSLDAARDQAVDLWRDLLKIGKIRNLEIRYYEFDPTFYFAIINDQYVHYGIYKIEHTRPGYHLYTMYTFDGNECEVTNNQLQDYKAFFGHVFDQFSYSDKDAAQ